MGPADYSQYLAPTDHLPTLMMLGIFILFFYNILSAPSPEERGRRAVAARLNRYKAMLGAQESDARDAGERAAAVYEGDEDAMREARWAAEDRFREESPHVAMTPSGRYYYQDRRDGLPWIPPHRTGI